MKNSLKIVIAFIIGAILTGTIVYAAVSAGQISYIREGTEITNVDQALNNLYSNSMFIYETGTYSLNINGGSNATAQISLSKAYTEAQHAQIFIYDISRSGNMFPLFVGVEKTDNRTFTKYISGNTYSFVIYNGAGGGSGTVTFNYKIIGEY